MFLGDIQCNDMLLIISLFLCLVISFLVISCWEPCNDLAFFKGWSAAVFGLKINFAVQFDLNCLLFYIIICFGIMICDGGK